MKDHYILHAIAVLAVIGFGISLYLLSLHYIPHESDSSLPCDINDVFSCSTVNQSTYAFLLGIPIALIGAFGFILISALSLFRFSNHKPLLVITSSLGFLFETYLTGIEAFVLHAYCLFCLIIYAILIIILLLSLKKFGKETLQFFKKIEFVD